MSYSNRYKLKSMDRIDLPDIEEGTTNICMRIYIYTVSNKCLSLWYMYIYMCVVMISCIEI